MSCGSNENSTQFLTKEKTYVKRIKRQPFFPLKRLIFNLYSNLDNPSNKKTMVKTSLTNLAKRLPMIRFRYGIGRESAKNISTSESYAHPTTAASSSSIPRGSSGPVIEDWQLPARYQRKPIDKYECEIINRGGRE